MASTIQTTSPKFTLAPISTKGGEVGEGGRKRHGGGEVKTGGAGGEEGHRQRAEQGPGVLQVGRAVSAVSSTAYGAARGSLPKASGEA